MSCLTQLFPVLVRGLMCTVPHLHCFFECVLKNNLTKPQTLTITLKQQLNQRQHQSKTIAVQKQPLASHAASGRLSANTDNGNPHVHPEITCGNNGQRLEKINPFLDINKVEARNLAVKSKPIQDGRICIFRHLLSVQFILAPSRS